MPQAAGYSGSPLEKKLGLKSGFVIRLINPPNHYFELFQTIPPDIEIKSDTKSPKDFIHFFTQEAAELEDKLPRLKQEIKANGMLWISWPKKASRVPTDITEGTIRDAALAIGLVDVKVCAVDIIWSGLKLVIPVKGRK
ncbi:hypothetical protein OKW21_004729 [Catalinimonas alkaloidigena]|uniref:DUF3052 family protein n=1 Tax=Catalinimonas alkaloidigena TaxID=1075417 RepID=UPI002407063D|nr:DUF3052 family protein [Catalinimonas alkaloidigena]MDF9799466.1 hypothetical protein [Catalinimonas alkaloidigena]